MGCYNETCALTRLPILAGDRCALLFVAPQPYGRRSPCHPWGLYVPVAPLFYGTYDDYGNLEDIEDDPEALGLLSAIPMSLDLGNGHHRNLYVDRDRPAAERLRELVAAAGRFELEGLFDDEYRPLYVIFMRRDFLDFVLENNKSAAEPEYLASTSFRLVFQAPMRDALRAIDPEWRDGMPVDAPPMQQRHAEELAALMAGMSALRSSFAPACNGGSQDALGPDWTRRFYLSMWARGEAIARLGDDDPLHYFEANSSWDGTYLGHGRNECAEPEYDAEPVHMDDPHDRFAYALEKSAANVLAAIDEDIDLADG